MKILFVSLLLLISIAGCKKEPIGHIVEIISDIPYNAKLIVDVDGKQSFSMLKSPWKSTAPLSLRVAIPIRAYYSDLAYSNIPITIIITNTNNTIVETKTENGSTEVSIGHD